MAGEEKKLCCGEIKKDYYNICSLLGEYGGAEHHERSYSPGVSSCETDLDCPDGWKCVELEGVRKCVLEAFGERRRSSYQNPPGIPLFVLAPVADYFDRFRSLKADAGRVMFAAITGDGLVDKDDKAAFISDECLENAGLKTCQAYSDLKVTAPECTPEPRSPGCEESLEAKLGCIRECFTASKGNPKNPTVARNTYVCNGDYADSDLGLRYIRLAEMFGPNGTVSNICSPEGMDQAMADIADMVVSVVK